MAGLPPLPNPDHFGGARVRGKRQSFLISAGYAAKLEWVAQDEMGQPVNLTTAYGATPTQITVRAQENFGAGLSEIACDSPSVGDWEAGKVKFTVPSSVTGQPGVYQCELAVKLGDDSIWKAATAYLVCERSTIGEAKGLPQYQEFRLALRDYAMDNELLDAIDFDLSEFAYAACRTVSWWNETAPLSTNPHTTYSFPFHDLWMRGIICYVFDTAAEHYGRNFIPGRALDDKNKMPQYAQRAAMMKKEVKEDMAARKMDLSHFPAFDFAAFPSGCGW